MQEYDMACTHKFASTPVTFDEWTDIYSIHFSERDNNLFGCRIRDNIQIEQYHRGTNT